MMVVNAKVRRDGVARPGCRWSSSCPATSSTSRPATWCPPTAGSSRAATLEIDESALTGESLPVPKQVEPVAADVGARRPSRPGVHEHPGDARRRLAARRRRPAWRPRSGTSAGMLPGRPRTRSRRSRVQLNTLTNQILVIAGVALAIVDRHRAVARHPVRRALPHCRRLLRVGDPDRPARRRDGDPVHGHDPARRGRARS